MKTIQKELDKLQKKLEKPDCYKCKYRNDNPYNNHSQCINLNAKAIGYSNQIKDSWSVWPVDFDPSWLVVCDGFERKEYYGKSPLIKIFPACKMLIKLQGANNDK